MNILTKYNNEGEEIGQFINREMKGREDIIDNVFQADSNNKFLFLFNSLKSNMLICQDKNNSIELLREIKFKKAEIEKAKDGENTIIRPKNSLTPYYTSENIIMHSSDSKMDFEVYDFEGKEIGQFNIQNQNNEDGGFLAIEISKDFKHLYYIDKEKNLHILERID